MCTGREEDAVMVVWQTRARLGKGKERGSSWGWSGAS